MFYYECDRCNRQWETEERDSYLHDLDYQAKRLVCPYCGYRNRVRAIHKADCKHERKLFWE